MKTLRLVLPLSLGFVLTLLVWWSAVEAVAETAVSHSPTGGTIRYVSPTGSNSVDCSNILTPCDSPQYAVSQSNDGDEIWVATGNYTGVSLRPAPPNYPGPAIITQTLYLVRDVTVRGGYSPDFSAWNPITYPTALNPQGQGRALFIAGDVSPIVEGFWLVNGNATGLGGHFLFDRDAGGGFYVITATATLSNLQIISNTTPTSLAPGGGGYFYHSPSTLQNSLVQSNTANHQGGGIAMFSSNVLLQGNQIQRNSSNSGAGVYAYQSSFTLNGNTLQENIGFSSGAGLAIENTDSLPQQPILHNNLIISNSLDLSYSFGGGIYLFFSDPAMSSNRIQNNSARFGGGAYLYLSSPTSTNDLFLQNQAVGIAGAVALNGSQARFLHPTISANNGGDGSGIYLVENSDFGSTIYSTAVFTNAILVSHTIAITASSHNTATLNGVLWFNNGNDTAGTGSFGVNSAVSGNPAFAPDGCHLTADSAAINQGIANTVITDIDGDLRPFDTFFDLGADEYIAPPPVEYHLFLPVVIRP